MNVPTNGENSIRIDNLEGRIDRHSKEWDDRFEAFGQKVDAAMEKITEKLSQVVEKFTERLHLIEISTLNFDKELSIKITRIAVKVAFVISIIMMVFGSIVTVLITQMLRSAFP